MVGGYPGPETNKSKNCYNFLKHIFASQRLHNLMCQTLCISDFREAAATSVWKFARIRRHSFATAVKQERIQCQDIQLLLTCMDYDTKRQYQNTCWAAAIAHVLLLHLVTRKRRKGERRTFENTRVLNCAGQIQFGSRQTRLRCIRGGSKYNFRFLSIFTRNMSILLHFFKLISGLLQKL